MELLDSLPRLTMPVMFLIAGACSAFLYFVLGKKSEFSWHAIQNTSATVIVVVANLFAFTYFVNDINAALQSGYDAIGLPTLPATFWGGWPIWAIAILGIILRDFTDYWTHRVMHTKWGWATHAAHHSDTHVNAFTSLRIHFLEVIVVTAGYVLLLTWLQMPHAIPFAILFHALHNVYVHLDVDIDHGPLKLLIASPAFHRWHHADVEEAHGKNLANVIPLWDKLFGTYYYPGHCREQMGALKSGVEDKDPVKILTYPFRYWAGLIRETAPESEKPEPQPQR